MTVKTFDDAYGRHAAHYSDERSMSGLYDHVTTRDVHPTRLADDYVARHGHGPGMHPVEWLVP